MIVAFLIMSLSIIKNDNSQSKMAVRIINKSEFDLSNISLFSIKFEDLGLKRSTDYKNLNFNIDSDDAMMYLTAKNKRFALYVSPSTVNGHYSYIIDSLSMQRSYIYMRKVRN